MCDDCLDAAYEQVDEKEREIERLKAQLEIAQQGRDGWYLEYRKAENALLEMNQLYVNAPYQHDETWVVPANSISEVFEKWVNDDV